MEPATVEVLSNILPSYALAFATNCHQVAIDNFTLTTEDRVVKFFMIHKGMVVNCVDITMLNRQVRLKFDSDNGLTLSYSIEPISDIYDHLINQQQVPTGTLFMDYLTKHVIKPRLGDIIYRRNLKIILLSINKITGINGLAPGTDGNEDVTIRSRLEHSPDGKHSINYNRVGI